MQALNLPKTELKFGKQGQRLTVYDIFRRKYVALTPEEWVRQHFVRYLVEHKGYPAARMATEVSLRLGNMQKRCDCVCYDRYMRPMVIIELKAPTVALSQEVMNQICRYNMAMHVPYLMLSNGLCHVCAHIDYEKGEYRYLNDIPLWNEICGEEASPQD